MALAKDRDTLQKEGTDIELPVAASTQIFGGGMVTTNATGYCVPAANTASFIFAGVALAGADNSAVATDGAINVSLRRKGSFLFAASGLTAADVGKTAYVSDDQTITLTAGNGVIAGKIVEVVSATSCWVDIDHN